MKIYGCNLLYQEFMPDYLFAIDPFMVEQIKIDAPACQFRETPQDEQFEPAEANPARPRNNTGMVAMLNAIRDGNTVLNLVGFDFVLSSVENCVSNLFDGQPGYGPETRCSLADTYNRCKYFIWFSQQHKNVTFRFIFPEERSYTHTRLPPFVQFEYATYQSVVNVSNPT
jgi:hypothetical protein